MGKLVLIIFLLSCTKYSKLVKNEDGSYYLTTDNLHLRNVAIVPWKVGIKSKQILTKGVVFTLNFPVLRKDDIYSLEETNTANSWIVRIRKSSALGSKALGYFYAPIFLPGVAELRAKQIKGFTLQIFYSAATLPDELINAPCPPMNHNKSVSKIFVDAKSNKPITFTLDGGYSLEESIQDYSYQTPTINGGNTLVGVYHFEITLFNHKNKKLIGDWVEYPETFTILKESELSLEECYDYTPSKLRPDYNDFKRFKWKEELYQEN